MPEIGNMTGDVVARRVVSRAASRGGETDPFAENWRCLWNAPWDLVAEDTNYLTARRKKEDPRGQTQTRSIFRGERKEGRSEGGQSLSMLGSALLPRYPDVSVMTQRRRAASGTNGNVLSREGKRYCTGEQ
jgi:hypothetical protein